MFIACHCIWNQTKLSISNNIIHFWVVKLIISHAKIYITKYDVSSICHQMCDEAKRIQLSHMWRMMMMNSFTSDPLWVWPISVRVITLRMNDIRRKMIRFQWVAAHIKNFLIHDAFSHQNICKYNMGMCDWNKIKVIDAVWIWINVIRPPSGGH